MAVKSMTSLAAMRTLMCEGRFETHLPCFSLEEVDEQHFFCRFPACQPYPLQTWLAYLWKWSQHFPTIPHHHRYKISCYQYDMICFSVLLIWCSRSTTKLFVNEGFWSSWILFYMLIWCQMAPRLRGGATLVSHQVTLLPHQATLL